MDAQAAQSPTGRARLVDGPSVLGTGRRPSVSSVHLQQPPAAALKVEDQRAERA